jgi:hypothetical protein
MAQLGWMVLMLNTKGKRKLEYMEQVYYWYIKLHDGIPKIHIMSEDKKLQLCYGFDKEIPVSSGYIVKLLSGHLNHNETK